MGFHSYCGVGFTVDFSTDMTPGMMCDEQSLKPNANAIQRVVHEIERTENCIQKCCSNLKMVWLPFFCNK
jgi:hypothetical protein